MRKKGKTSQYDVNQSNLITRIKEDMFEIILNPTREKVRKVTKDFIKKCIHSPNKIKESKKYKRKKKQFKPKFTANYKLNF